MKHCIQKRKGTRSQHQTSGWAELIYPRMTKSLLELSHFTLSCGDNQEGPVISTAANLKEWKKFDPLGYLNWNRLPLVYDGVSLQRGVLKMEFSRQNLQDTARMSALVSVSGVSSPHSGIVDGWIHAAQECMAVFRCAQRT